MKLRISYRLHLQIYYDKISIELPDDSFKETSFIKQDCKFRIQKEFGQIVAALYINEADIKKYKLVKDG